MFEVARPIGIAARDVLQVVLDVESLFRVGVRLWDRAICLTAPGEA
jgi:hypothetical protein